MTDKVKTSTKICTDLWNMDRNGPIPANRIGLLLRPFEVSINTDVVSQKYLIVYFSNRNWKLLGPPTIIALKATIFSFQYILHMCRIQDCKHTLHTKLNWNFVLNKRHALRRVLEILSLHSFLSIGNTRNLSCVCV